MSGVDYLLTARVTLDVAERARALVQEARSVLDAFGDDEGTE